MNPICADPEGVEFDEAFTCSSKEKDANIEYVKTQDKHHARDRFKDELRALLRVARIKFGENNFAWPGSSHPGKFDPFGVGAGGRRFGPSRLNRDGYSNCSPSGSEAKDDLGTRGVEIRGGAEDGRRPVSVVERVARAREGEGGGGEVSIAHLSFVIAHLAFAICDANSAFHASFGPNSSPKETPKMAFFFRL